MKFLIFAIIFLQLARVDSLASLWRGNGWFLYSRYCLSNADVAALQIFNLFRFIDCEFISATHSFVVMWRDEVDVPPKSDLYCIKKMIHLKCTNGLNYSNPTQLPLLKE